MQSNQAVEREIRERWFKDHVAKFTEHPDGTKILEWRNKDGSSIYWFTAVFHRGNLLVYGDIGDAIYRWYGSTNHWEFFADMNIEYFESKCCASETGHRYYDWNEKRVLSCMLDHMRLTAESRDKTDKEVDEEVWRLCLHFFDEGGIEAADNEDSWQDWYNQHYDEEELVGMDAWEWVPNCGRVVACRCVAHLIGIQMALKQREVQNES